MELAGWTSARKICDYLYQGFPIGLRLSYDQPLLIGQLTSFPDEVACQMASFHPSHIQQMFTGAFWKRDVVCQGAQALRLTGPQWSTSTFPREWVAPLLEIYGSARDDLNVNIERAHSVDNLAEYRKLQALRDPIDLFWECWHASASGTHRECS